jgi:hypothetical protein
LIPAPLSDSEMGEGNHEVVEGEVTLTMLEITPSVSRERMSAQSTSLTRSSWGRKENCADEEGDQPQSTIARANRSTPSAS